MSLLRRQSIPLHGFPVVLWNPPAVVVHPAEVVLGQGISLRRRQSIPLLGFPVVLWNPPAVVVHPAEVVLGRGVSFRREPLEFPQCAGVVIIAKSGLAFLNSRSHESWDHGNGQSQG